MRCWLIAVGCSLSACPYAEREWTATPGSAEMVQAPQAFAWNPIVRGALSFDTFVVYRDWVENVAATEDWPVTDAETGGMKLRRPDILIRKDL